MECVVLEKGDDASLTREEEKLKDSGSAVVRRTQLDARLSINAQTTLFRPHGHDPEKVLGKTRLINNFFFLQEMGKKS